MQAKIRDISFSPDSIIGGVDFYFSKGEAGYDACWIDVPDRPAAFGGEVEGAQLFMGYEIEE